MCECHFLVMENNFHVLRSQPWQNVLLQQTTHHCYYGSVLNDFLQLY